MAGVDMTLVQETSGPYAPFWRRAGLRPQDQTVIRTAFIEDEYGLKDLPPLLSGSVVVDVGACIGAFSALAHALQPEARIFSIEALPENMPALMCNVGQYATAIHAAVTYEEGDLGILSSIVPGTHASGGSIVQPISKIETNEDDRYEKQLTPLPKLTLDKLVQDFRIDRIAVLKLDCEGGEWSILQNARCLNRVDAIVGEYHGPVSDFRLMLETTCPREHWWWRFWEAKPRIGNFGLYRRRCP